ncbi:uracil-DNA glycosylase [Acuticoccus sp.]|uniref:uracil-DNA glycosylase n=1 Tax=Acuticoccus sp. TaxID=1904378 RepID=UPI003B5303EE
MEEAQPVRGALALFLRDCGVTTELREVPQNRFVALEPAERRPADDEGPPVPATEEGDDVSVQAAREVAREATSLEALHAVVRTFEGCPLRWLARSTCVGEGPVGAPLMLVGEAPGRDEDEAGRPFVGRSGQLLERMLAAIGLARADVYITNVIPWRPPANRTPSPIETATCEVFVRCEIALVRPTVLLALGGAAAKTLFANDAGIMRQRGQWRRFDAGELEIDAMATLHPAFLLRNPAQKARAWQDLLAVHRRLKERRVPFE